MSNRSARPAFANGPGPRIQSAGFAQGGGGRRALVVSQRNVETGVRLDRRISLTGLTPLGAETGTETGPRWHPLAPVGNRPLWTPGAAIPVVVRDSALSAEGEGFEPSVRLKPHNGFRDEGWWDAVSALLCGRFAAHHRRIQGFRVTGRDKEIVRWIGRLRMVQAAHVSERFSLGRAVTYARLSGLVQLDLLEHARVFHGAPGVYLATRAGLAAVDVELPPAKIDLRTYAHDLELTALVIELEREFAHPRVVTEREDAGGGHAAGGRADPGPAVRRSLAGARGRQQLTPAGHPRLHFPDCAITDQPGDRAGILAVELERTAKGRARLRRILAGYVSARHISAVRYYALGDRVREVVGSEVGAQRAQALIEVRDWPIRRHLHGELDTAA